MLSSRAVVDVVGSSRTELDDDVFEVTSFSARDVVNTALWERALIPKWMILKTRVHFTSHPKRYETRLKYTVGDCNVLLLCEVNRFEKHPNEGINDGDRTFLESHALIVSRCPLFGALPNRLMKIILQVET